MNNPIFLVLLAFTLTFPGCSTNEKNHARHHFINYKDAGHGIKVWRAEKVDVAKYKTLVVRRPTSNIPPQNEEAERLQFERVVTELHNGLSSQILARSLVSAATLAKTNSPATTPGNEAAANSLIVESEIVDYRGDKSPSIVLKGLLRDGANSETILRFAVRRSLGPHASKSGDETILVGQIRDLASDCAEVIVTTLKSNTSPMKP